MPGNYLLDTNIVIALFRQDAAVLEMLEQSESVFTCAHVLGELYFGALNSARRDENRQIVDEFAAKTAVLACDSETALNYANVRTYLKNIGRPIPENDVWIAATAIQHGLILVSRDRHFTVIESMSVKSWD